MRSKGEADAGNEEGSMGQRARNKGRSLGEGDFGNEKGYTGGWGGLQNFLIGRAAPCWKRQSHYHLSSAMIRKSLRQHFVPLTSFPSFPLPIFAKSRGAPSGERDFAKIGRGNAKIGRGKEGRRRKGARALRCDLSKGKIQKSHSFRIAAGS